MAEEIVCSSCGEQHEEFHAGEGLCKVCYGQKYKLDWGYKEFDDDKRAFSPLDLFVKATKDFKEKEGKMPPAVPEGRRLFLSSLIRFIWAHYVAGSDPPWVSAKLAELEMAKRGIISEFIEQLSDPHVGPKTYVDFCGDLLPFPDYIRETLSNTKISWYPWRYFVEAADWLRIQHKSERNFQ